MSNSSGGHEGPSYTVRWIGKQLNLMRGDISAHVRLETFAGIPDLYAVGPVEGVKGEVTIINGEPSVSWLDGVEVVIDTSFARGACFLVWSRVTRWQEAELPVEVRSEGDLERYIPWLAESCGLDPGRPFPFLIVGQPSRVVFHILNKTNKVPHSPEEHDRAKVRLSIEARPLQIVGFQSDAHRGIFTPSNSDLHMHVRTDDRLLSGHVEHLTLSGDERFFLPPPPPLKV